jgi:hypothetical protein
MDEFGRLERYNQKREKIIEESRKRCSLVYAEIFEIFSRENHIDKTRLDFILKSLKPKEKKIFEDIISEINSLQETFEEICKMDAAKVFEDLFGFQPVEKVELIFNPRFPILEIGALDSYNLNFAGIAGVIQTRYLSKDGLRISVNIFNRDTKIKDENSTIEQKARFVISIIKIIKETCDTQYGELDQYEKMAKIIIDVLTKKITWNTEVSNAIKMMFDKLFFKKNIEKLYANFEAEVKGLDNLEIEDHEFRHVLQLIIAKNILTLEKENDNQKVQYDNLFEGKDFFNRKDNNLNENETVILISRFNQVFELSKKLIRFKVAQELSAFLYDFKDGDYTENCSLLKTLLSQENYLKMFTNFRYLESKINSSLSSENAIIQEKLATQIKEIFLKEADKFCQKIVEEFLEITKQKQDEGMTGSQIPAYIDLLAL